MRRPVGRTMSRTGAGALSPPHTTCSGMAAKSPLGGPPRELTLIRDGLGHPGAELGGQTLGSPRKWAVGGPRSRAGAPASTEKA